jgi:hypothetical protein
MLSPSRPLLSAFVAALAFASVISAETLTFTWPKYPEANVDFPLTWSGGTPPVRGANRLRAIVLSIDLLFFVRCLIVHGLRAYS